MLSHVKCFYRRTSVCRRNILYSRSVHQFTSKPGHLRDTESKSLAYSGGCRLQEDTKDERKSLFICIIKKKDKKYFLP